MTEAGVQTATLAVNVDNIDVLAANVGRLARHTTVKGLANLGVPLAFDVSLQDGAGGRCKTRLARLLVRPPGVLLRRFWG